MNVLQETIEIRMNDLGLEFMAAGLESFLEAQSQTENTLSQPIDRQFGLRPLLNCSFVKSPKMYDILFQ